MEKLIFIIFLLHPFIQIIFSQETKPGILIGARQSPKVAVCSGGFTRVCDGCTDIAICAGGEEPIFTAPCSYFSPNLPYCVDGKCSPTPEEGSIDCENQFRCSQEGYFPDPDNCSKYYICTGENGNSFEYNCGPNYIYNSKKKTCQRKVLFRDCRKVNCTGVDNGYVVYQPDKAFYTFCSNDKGRREKIMYRCFDGETSEFDLASLSCIFKCPNVGRFANPADCKSFYECYRTNQLIIKWLLLQCPPGNYRYNPELRRCEIGSCT